MKIGIIDSDLIGRKNHKFPNLALMKISTFEKANGNLVNLLLSYNNLKKYDKIYLAKVFSDTSIGVDIGKYNNLVCGGTGFFSENAPQLPYEIEHTTPDYTLYDIWRQIQTQQNVSRLKLKYFTDYSIGYTTRGCFRKCDFCVNKSYDRVELCSPLEEFVIPTHKNICLLDDNILGYGKHRDIIQQLIDTGKKFQFKQGMDIRLLRKDTAELLATSKYDGDFIFAFDNVKDYDLVEKKLQKWRDITNRNTKFYVLVAYYSCDIVDIMDMFERIQLLMRYSCIPYIMRYQSYKTSNFYDLYTQVARWCNQPSFYKKMSFAEFCIAHGTNHITYKIYIKYCNEHEELIPYFDMKFENRGV